MHVKLNRNGLLAFGKEAIWAALVTVAFSLITAIGLSAPTQALAAAGANELAAGSVQTSSTTVEFFDDMELWAGDVDSKSLAYYVEVSGDDGEVSVTNVVSSNPAVLKVQKVDSLKTVWSYNVYPMKEGTAKLTLYYKTKGKAKTASHTYSVATLPDGIKSISLNGEPLLAPTSKNAVSEMWIYDFKATSAKLDIVTENGWVMSSARGDFNNRLGTVSLTVDIENGKPFTIPEGYDGSINLSFSNENSDIGFSYSILISRDKPFNLTKGVYFVGYPKYSDLPINELYEPEDIQVVSVAFSKPSIFKAKLNKNINKVKLQAKKAGKSKVVVTYKVDGRIYTASTTCTALSYPLKSVKLNGKAINLKKNSLNYSVKRFKKSSATVKFVPAKGWKVVKTQYYNGKGKVKTVKNGSSVSVPKRKHVFVSITLKKGKTRFEYYVNLNSKYAKIYD